MRIYLFMQWLLRTATRVFFRRIEVVGLENIPNEGEGAVIFCGNHPNSLIDPVMITAYCGRIVHFAAKDVLFQNRILRFLLQTMGAVPIKRRVDHKGSGAKIGNESAFSALHKVLGDGRAIGIFPEGLSHDDSQLAPLKTGAARIAFGAKREHPKTRVFLVPAGLCYFKRNRFRSSVLVQFGEPHEVELEDIESVEPKSESPAEATATLAETSKARVRELTDEIDAHLRSLTINASSWETIWVLDGVRRLYQPDGISLEQRVELSRRFNKVYPDVADEPTVVSLYKRIKAYLQRLSAAGLGDDVLREPVRVRDVVWRIAGHTILLLGALPLAIIGAPIHLPLLFLFRLAGKYFSPRSDVVATTKFLVGFLTVNLVYVGLVLFTWWKLNIFWAILVAILFPLSGRAVLHVISRADALRNIFLTSFRILRFRQEVEALRTERAQLVARVNRAVDRFRPDDMPALFPDHDRPSTVIVESIEEQE